MKLIITLIFIHFIVGNFGLWLFGTGTNNVTNVTLSASTENVLLMTTESESILTTDQPIIESRTTPISEVGSFSTDLTNSVKISSTDYIKSITTVPIILPQLKEDQMKNPDQDINEGPVVDSFPELKKIFNSEYLSDLKIVTGQSRKINVHQFVLILKSSVFADIIKNLYSDELSINDEEYDIYYELIKFLYTEKFPIDSGTDFNLIANVYLLAQKYKVNRLMKVIEENLNKTLNLQNFKKVFDFLYKKNMTVTYWRQFVRQNSEEIFQKNLYSTGDPYTIESIIYSMDMNGTQKVMAIEGLVRQKRSDIDITRYKRLITIEECHTEQLSALKHLRLLNIDDNEIFEKLIDKLNKLCTIEKQVQILIKQFKTMDETLQQKNEQLMECRVHTTPRQPINNYYYPYDLPINNNNQFKSSVSNKNGPRVPINLGL